MSIKIQGPHKNIIKIILFVFMIFGPMQLAFASSSNTVVFGAQSWPGITVKTEVASQILQKIGYQTKTIQAATSVLDLGLMKNGKKSVDVSLAIWLPSAKKKYDRMMKSGKVKNVTLSIKNARYGLAVPNYVWKKGVHSIADLHKYPQKFNQKIYGIEAGNSGNNIMKKAIKRNTYNLKNWQVVPSSTAAMMTQVGRAIKKHKWIVFLAWSPHWMNIKYNINYLKDPKGIWGKQSKIYILANKQFIKNNPNVARFLRQFVLPAKVQSNWIYDFSVKKESKKKVAHKWIQNHMDMVRKWLHGVKTANGQKPAISAWK